MKKIQLSLVNDKAKKIIASCDEIKTKYNEKLTINDFVFIPLTNLI